MITDKIKSLIGGIVNKKASDSTDLVSGSIVSVVSKSAELVVRYLFVVLLANFVGAEEMGRYSVVIGSVMIIVAIAQLGLQTAFVQIASPLYVEKNFAAIKQLSLNIYKKIFISGGISSIALFFAADFLATVIFNKPYLASYFKAFSFAILPYLLVNMQSHGFMAMKRMPLFSLSFDLSIPLFNLALLLLGSTFLKDGALIQFFFVFAPMAASILVSYLWLKESKFFSSVATTVNYSPAIWKISQPLLVSTVVTQLLSWGDVFFIGRLYPDADMAIYNIALRVAVFVGIPLLAIETSTAMLFSTSFHQKNYDKLKMQVQRATFLALIYSLPIFAGLILFGKSLLSIFGSEFVQSYPLMLLLLVGQFVNVITGPVGVLLNMTDQQRAYKNISIATAALLLVLNALLIPRFGTTGAAWATMIFVVVRNGMYYFWVKYHFGFSSINLSYMTNKLHGVMKR